MKRIKKLVILLVILLAVTGCNKKYRGYWCNYEETAHIEIQLERDVTDKQKETIEAAVNKFENLESLNYFNREEIAREKGLSVDDLDMYDAYILKFNSMDSIGTYVEDLGKIAGVHKVTQINAKSNISLYELKKHSKYTYTDSDDPDEEGIESGKYKIKNGVITFTNEKTEETKILYIKNDILCGDSECNQIFAKSDSKCGA